MKTNLEKSIEAYEVAGENVRNAAYVAFVDHKNDISLEVGRELMERLMRAELDGSRAERRILEAVAITTARENSLN